MKKIVYNTIDGYNNKGGDSTMYKVIIADDEIRTRKFIINILKNRLSDFQIVGDFSDGREIIEYLKSNSVDVVLCDIKMIDVSGIEVAKWIYHNMPKIKVVFLSAYQDFSFAAAAVKYNVVEYLTKPIHIPDLLIMFNELKKTLDIEKQDLDIINYYKREVFNNLLQGFYSSQNHIDEALSSIHSKNLAMCECGILNVGINNFKFDKTVIENQFQNIATLSDKSNFVFYISHTEDSILFLLFLTRPDLSSLMSVSEKLCNNIITLFNVNASIKSLETHKNIYELNENTLSSSTDFESIRRLEEEIIVSVNSCDYSQLSSLLDSLSNIYKDYSLDKLKSAYSNFIIRLNNILFENTIIDTDIQDLTEKLKIASDITSVSTIIESYFSKIISLRNNNDAYVQNVLNIRNYIVEHCEQQLSLSEIASMAHYTTTWFSRMFKEVTGQTYIDFLITCRMNKAKQLLINTNMRVADIGIAVGYENTHSFNKIFKSRCSVSPSEYRRKYTGADSYEKK